MWLDLKITQSLTKHLQFLQQEINSNSLMEKLLLHRCSNRWDTSNSFCCNGIVCFFRSCEIVQTFASASRRRSFAEKVKKLFKTRIKLFLKPGDKNQPDHPRGRSQVVAVLRPNFTFLKVGEISSKFYNIKHNGLLQLGLLR